MLIFIGRIHRWLVQTFSIEYHILTRVQASDKVLTMYGDSINSALDAELPDVIAHPDLFMQARDNFGELEEKSKTRKIWNKKIFKVKKLYV